MAEYYLDENGNVKKKEKKQSLFYNPLTGKWQTTPEIINSRILNTIETNKKKSKTKDGKTNFDYQFSKKDSLGNVISGLTWEEVQEEKKKYPIGTMEFDYLNNYTNFATMQDFDKALQYYKAPFQYNGQRMTAEELRQNGLSVPSPFATTPRLATDLILGGTANATKGVDVSSILGTPTSMPSPVIDVDSILGFDKKKKEEQTEQVTYAQMDTEYISELETARKKHELDNKFDYYRHYTEKKDYEEKSQYDKNKVEKNLFGNVKKSSELYFYMNADDGERAKHEMSYGMDASMSMPEEFAYVKKMTEDEKGVYNYIYNTQGEDKAQEYFDELKPNLSRRNAKRVERQMEAFADESPVTASALSIPFNVVGGAMGGMDAIVSKVQGEEVDTYGKNFGGNLMATTIRNKVSQNIQEETEGVEIFGTNVPSFLYQTGMSIGDSAVGRAMFGKGYSVIAGSSAYQTKARELYEAGEDAETIERTALLSGAWEVIFEHASYDKLLKNTSVIGRKQVIKSALKQAGIEASEEFHTELANIFTDSLSRGDSSEFAQLRKEMEEQGYSDEEIEKQITKQAIRQLGEATVGGAISGGVMGAGYSARNNANYTKTEKQFISDTTKERVEAEEKRTGKKLTEKEKLEIQDEVVKALHEGDFSREELEQRFGGETYEEYKRLVEEADEYENLASIPTDKLSLTELKRRTSLDAKNTEKSYKERKAESYSKLTDAVKEATGKSSMLDLSYGERGRRAQQFTVSEEEMQRYSEKERAIVQKAIDYGEMNNTRRAHNYVDLVAKASADRELDFEFVNNAILEKMGLAVEGKTINGLKIGNKIAINMESQKVLETVVGHEITHTFEKDEQLYESLAKFVKEFGEAKGIYKSLYDTAFQNYRKAYESMTEEEYQKAIEKEVIADLVGDYIFTDVAFVRNLSTKNRNIFQKIYDEIKYMIKLANAGSQEEAQLLKAKKMFEEVYRETSTNTSNDTQLSVSDNQGKKAKDLIATHNLTADELWTMVDEGGLVSPSVAINKTGIESFGEATVLLAKDSIDPRQSDNNRVWGADAWTPSRNALKINPVFNEQNTADVVNNLKTKTNGLFTDTVDNFKKNLQDKDGNIYDAYANSYEMQTAYAMEKGLLETIPTDKNGNVDSEILEDNLDSIFDKDNNWRDYKVWLNGISDSVIESYDKATTDDVLRNMQSQPDTSKPFNLKLDGGLVVPAVKYNTINEIRRNKGRLVGDATTQTEAVGQEFVQWRNSINADVAEVTKAINSAFETRYELQEIKNTFKKRGIDISLVQARNLQKLYEKAVALPTEYFEAQPVRKVTANEIRAVVVPNNLDASLKQALSEGGYNVTEYNPNVEGDRHRAISQFNELKFSLSDNQGRTLTKEQGEFFKDSKVRDENGNLLVMYHGTPNGDYTVFREGTYFTQSKEYADVYQNQGASSLGYKQTANNPKTYEAYLNIKKPFDTRNSKEREIFESEYYGQWGMGTPLQESGLPDWMDGEDLMEFLQEKGYDYDGLILDEGGVGGYGDVVKSRGYSYVVFNPNQVKNIDNTKPTDNADIRYSISEDRWADLLDDLFLDAPTEYTDVNDLFLDAPTQDADNSNANNQDKKQRAKRRVDEVNKKLREIGLSFNGTRTASWTDERIDKYLSGGYYASTNPNYAQAYITYMSPQEFLNLTVGGKPQTLEMIQNESAEYGEVDFDKLGNSVPVHLYIEEGKNGAKVVGHEGRHRMLLLGKAGFEKIPVLMFDFATKYSKSYKDSMKLKAQTFGNGAFVSSTRDVVASDIVPFSQGNRDVIIQKFGSGNQNADIQYSLSDNIDKEYMQAVERGDMETAQRLVNEASERAGYTTDKSWKMQHTAPNSKDGVSLLNLRDSDLVPKDYWEHPEWYTYSAEERESFAKVTKAFRMLDLRKEAGKDTNIGMYVYRAVDKTKNAKEESLRNGDWVTPSYDYAVQEGKRNPNGHRIIKQFAKLKDLYWDGNSIAEFGYDDGKAYSHKDTKNNRKLLETVTYDDDGNIIPLSKRFNFRKADERYSLSDNNQLAPKNPNLTYADDVALEKPIAPIEDTAQPTRVQEDAFAPLTEQEAHQMLDSEEEWERINSLQETQEPQEVEAPIFSTDTGRLSEVDLREVRKGIKDHLPLQRGRTQEFNDIVQKYATSEFPSRQALYNEVKQKFGKVTVAEEMTDIADAQRMLRQTRINVSDNIKNGTTDYLYTMRSNFGRIRFSKDGIPVDVAYQELSSMYPHLFPDDIVNEIDQFEQILDVANMERMATGEYAVDEDALNNTVNSIMTSIRDINQRHNQNVAERRARWFDKERLIEEYMQTDDYADLQGNPKLVEVFHERWDRNKLATEQPQVDTRVAENLTYGKKTFGEVLQEKKQGIARKWAIFKSSIIDKGAVFEDLSKVTKNRRIEELWDYQLSSTGQAVHLIMNGENNVTPLIEIEEKVMNTNHTEDFEKYMYHNLNIDRMTLDSRFGIENKSVYGSTITSDISQEIVQELEQAHPEFKQYAQEIYAWNTNMRNKLVEAGIISQETADLWQEMYPHYVPIKRVDSVGKNINVPLATNRTGVNAPIKRAEGGSSDIMPMFDTMKERATQTITAINKNMFGVELKNTLGSTLTENSQSVDEAIEMIETQDALLQEGKNGLNPTFTVFENGKRITFEITQEMYEALSPMSKRVQDFGIVPLQKLSSFHRAVLTEYNPVFMFYNFIKDTQDVFLNSQHALKTYLSIPEAIAQLTTKGEYDQEYKRNGGADTSYFEVESQAIAPSMKKGVKNILTLPFQKISDINNFVERIPRMAEYIASRKMGKDEITSMLDASRVTTNFKAGGDVTKFLNKNGFTFLNASVQGATQQVRNWREANQNGLKGYVKLATKYALAGITPYLLNAVLWDDDEEYEELSDYVKQNYYVVGKTDDGKFFRIPKGRAVSVIQEAVEQMDNMITGDDEADFNTFFKLVMSNVAPNNPLTNNVVAPIVQIKKNESWYGEEIVPESMQALPSEEQYDETTDSLSKAIGEKLKVSPMKVNYLLKQYGGIIGDVALPFMTPEATSDDEGAELLLAPLKDKFITDGKTNKQSISDFYDMSDTLTTNALRSNATPEDILKNKYFNSVKGEMNELYKQKREVQNSNLSRKEKYEQVRQIQEQISELAKQGLKNYEDVEIYENYGRVNNTHYRVNNDGEWQKLTDKQLERQESVTSGLGIDASEYWSKKDEYDYAYDYPGKYGIAKVFGGYDSYMQYLDELYDFESDKDENGDSIPYSLQRKKFAYIESLDVDEYTKLILKKQQYKSHDEYNYDIIEYLNSRDDISYQEMVDILEALDFTVDEEGYVGWD